MDETLGGLEVGSQASTDTNNVLTADPAKLKQWQQQDPSLKRARELAGGEQAGDNNGASFYYKEELLYQQWYPRGKTSEDMRCCEQPVLHDSAVILC